MEKLIQYLNEYEEEKTDLTFKPHFWDAYRGHLTFLEYNSKYSELLCISKRYEFIKRLNENDKIDRDKKEIEKSDYDITFTGALTKDKKSDLDIMVDTLLMLLSISDTPIDDLILYLK